MRSHISKTEYETSLKSIETENYIDRLFFRPVGFLIAKGLIHTCITPNMVTIFSIFVGAAAGPLFYFHNIYFMLGGFLCLIFANLLDCVDGQLARLTNRKSKIGRILDGLAGDIWFLLIYIFLTIRLKNEYGTWLFIIPAIMSGVSHLLQANITDYYKTLHLYFINAEKGSEFQNFDEVHLEYKQMESGIRKGLFYFYLRYTALQEAFTPHLQMMIHHLHAKYNHTIPENIRLDFRCKSSALMKSFIDFLTFNNRVIILFLTILSGYAWAYFVFEIIVMNLVLWVSICKHEKICTVLLMKDEANGFNN